MEVWTIGKIVKWTEEYFKKFNIDSPRLDAEVLLAHVLQKDRMYLYVHFDQPLNPDELARYKDYIKKRAVHMPVAYIIGSREFMGLDFKVTEATLIPRPDTEITVEAVLERLKKYGNRRIADLGTGSGAICLSLLHYDEELTAVTVDISPNAIAVAKENAENLGVAERIEFYEGDMLEPLQDKGKFTAIVSNPPYIPKADIATLESDVKEYEPMNALDGGADGLDFYRQLLAKAADYLVEDGFLAIEVGIGQSAPLKKIAGENPVWGKVEILPDLAGIDRCMVFYRA